MNPPTKESLAQETPEVPQQDFTAARKAFDKIRMGSNAEPDPEPAEEVEEEETREEAAAPEEPREPSERAKKARDYLRLKTKTPQRVLEGMDEEELVSWERGVRDREAQVDDTFHKNAELERRLRELEAANKPEERQPASTLDLKKLLEPLKGEFGEDATTHLSGALEEALAPLRDQLAKQSEALKGYEAQIERARENEYQQALEAQRVRLAPRRELNQAQLTAVAFVANEILGRGGKGVNEAFDEAMTEIYGEEVKASEREESDDKDTFLPTPSRRAPKKDKVSPERRARMIFDAQRKHGDWGREQLVDYGNKIKIK